MPVKMQTERLISRVQGLAAEMQDFTASLVAIPSENPPGDHYQECADLIVSKLSDLGIAHEIIEDRQNNLGPCIVARLGQGTETLYFHGHYDVVPGKNQFTPFVKDGNLFGRGSADMKGGLAAMLYAAVALREEQIDLNRQLALVFVPDEETTGPRGSRYLSRLNMIGRDGIGMLTPEPTSGVICNASRGTITLQITVKGKSAHVGLHYQGINAFEHMLMVGKGLLTLKRKIEERRTGFCIEPEAAKRSILMIGGLCQGGENFNVVPKSMTFTVERRINPEEDVVEERTFLLDYIEQFSKENGISLDVKVLQEGNSAGVSERTELAQALENSIELVTGSRPRFEMCPGMLEIRFYAERGIPAYAYGPGLLSASHGPQEFVSVDNIVNCASIYALSAARLLC